MPKFAAFNAAQRLISVRSGKKLGLLGQLAGTALVIRCRHEAGPVEDFDILKALTRKYITERGGEIIQWRELEPR